VGDDQLVPIGALIGDVEQEIAGVD
jgi:hypothetical protein